MRRALAIALTVLCLSAVAIASNRDRRFFSARDGVGVDAPPGWVLSQHNGYSAVLVTLVHPSGARISLAVDRATVKDAAALAEQSRPGLGAQGLAVERVAPGPRGGALLEAHASKRDQRLRQLYLVRDVGGDQRQAIVLTLVAPSAELQAASGAFDWVVAHLSLEAPIHPDEKPDGGR
jgi:hypothetical protein